MYLHILRRLSDAAGRKCPENGEPTVGFYVTTMLQHTGWFLVKDFFAKNNVTTEASPISPALAAADLYLLP